jgi:hypothetical protein
VVDHLLKFGGGLIALMKLEEGLPTHINRVEESTGSELRRRKSQLVTRGGFKEFKSLGGIALVELNIARAQGNQ